MKDFAPQFLRNIPILNFADCNPIRRNQNDGRDGTNTATS